MELDSQIAVEPIHKISNCEDMSDVERVLRIVRLRGSVERAMSWWMLPGATRKLAVPQCDFDGALSPCDRPICSVMSRPSIPMD